MHKPSCNRYRGVFERAREDAALRPLLKRGAFQELELGRLLLRQAKRALEKIGPASDQVSRGVQSVCSEWGGYLWNGGGGERDFLIFHLHSAGHAAQWECGAVNGGCKVFDAVGEYAKALALYCNGHIPEQNVPRFWGHREKVAARSKRKRAAAMATRLVASVIQAAVNACARPKSS